MEQYKCFIQVIKVKYSFNDGTNCSGIELHLAPKVKKFINLNKDNCDLLKMMGNGLIEWYNRADYGDDIMLEYNYEVGGYSVPVKVG